MFLHYGRDDRGGEGRRGEKREQEGGVNLLYYVFCYLLYFIIHGNLESSGCYSQSYNLLELPAIICYCNGKRINIANT